MHTCSGMSLLYFAFGALAPWLFVAVQKILLRESEGGIKYDPYERQVCKGINTIFMLCLNLLNSLVVTVDRMRISWKS